MSDTCGKRFLFLCLLLGGILVIGPAVNTAQAAADAFLQQGIDHYHRGDQQQALSLLRGFVIRNANSPELPTAYLYLARIFQQQGRHQETLLYTARIPADQKGPEALLVEGVSQAATGQYQAALTSLLRTDPGHYSDADRASWYAALAQARAGLGQYLEALACVQRGVPPGANPSYQLAHTLLREKLTPPELAEAAFMFQGTAIGRDALLQQAEQAVKRQDPQEARRLLTLVLTDPAPFPYLADAMALGEQLDYFPVQQRSIGVMLPLSGRYATFGQLVQRGMELAAEEHNRNASPIRLIFRDTGASAEESVRIVGEFAANPNVLAIAGPLTGGASVSAAEEAQRYRLPLFSLSPREGLPEMGSYIFRDSLTSRQQVQALVSYAMECLGLTTFGILHPENKLGYEMAELFIQEVQTRGGQIIATEMYSEKDTDYRYQIKLLNGEDPNLPDVEETPEDADEVLGEEEEEEVPPPFQALFIPDYADKISMIAPQLIFYGIEDVQLLGINGWNSADLLRSTGRYLQNAIFVDGFYRDSRNPLIQQFVAAYRDKYGEEPSILEAQGYDVASILLQQLQRSNSMSRQQLQQNLLLLQNYPGVSGDTTFTLAGDAYKPLFVLQIQNGKIVELN